MIGLISRRSVFAALAGATVLPFTDAVVTHTSDDDGVPADFWSWRMLPAQHEVHDVQGRISEMAEIQRATGATFFRATLHKNALWMEGWRERPHQQPHFYPPITDERVV